jgi:hypothetical protein
MELKFNEISLSFNIQTLIVISTLKRRNAIKHNLIATVNCGYYIHDVRELSLEHKLY